MGKFPAKGVCFEERDSEDGSKKWWRFERTENNQYTERLAQIGDERGWDVFDGRNWKLKEGLVRFSFMGAHKNKKVDLTQFETVRNHEWQPSTIDEARVKFIEELEVRGRTFFMGGFAVCEELRDVWENFTHQRDDKENQAPL